MNIEETLKKLGFLVIENYRDGRITQQEEADMLELINHLSLKDFVRPERKDKKDGRSTELVTSTS